MFTEEKTAQMAAYLLAKAGGSMPYLKLMKLLYLSDRESMRVTGDSISHDQFVSMPHGPVLSRTLELINGYGQSPHWSTWISPGADYSVQMSRTFQREELGELSPMDLAIMDGVFAQFGAMDKWQIRDFTHTYCREWQDPNGSSMPIAPRSIFHALGFDATTAEQMADDYQERRELERVMARYA